MDKDKLLKVFDNQSILIESLKNENKNLNLNFKKFRETQKIVEDHDYVVVCTINPLKVNKVEGVPKDGFLGYSCDEFTDNTFKWNKSKMFSKREISRINKEHRERVDYALELGLDHFDIRLNVPFFCKDRSKVWSYYVSFYDLVINEVKMYIKFLQHDSE
jgi:hypothetical protein